MSMDARFCYGACCTWFGSIHEIKVNTVQLPCCPKCYGVLYEMDNEGEWWRGVDGFERGDSVLTKRSHPGYRTMWEWARSQPMCFRNLPMLAKAYEKATGIVVDYER